MARPLKPAGGKCPQDEQRDQCNLVCKYNYFESGDLAINSWELKCLDCGLRQTIAYRTDDEEEEDQPEDPQKCPFCQLTNLPVGKNPCQSNK